MIAISNQLFGMETKIKELVQRNDFNGLQHYLTYLTYSSKKNELNFDSIPTDFSQTLENLVTVNINKQKRNLSRKSNRIIEATGGLFGITLSIINQAMNLIIRDHVSQHEKSILFFISVRNLSVAAFGSYCLKGAIKNSTNIKAYDDSIRIKNLLTDKYLIGAIDSRMPV